MDINHTLQTKDHEKNMSIFCQERFGFAPRSWDPNDTSYQNDMTSYLHKVSMDDNEYTNFKLQLKLLKVGIKNITKIDYVDKLLYTLRELPNDFFYILYYFSAIIRFGCALKVPDLHRRSFTLY